MGPVKKRISDLALIGVFLALISAGLVGTFGRDYLPTFQENRKLAQAPQIGDLDSPLALPGVISNYFADNFGMRKLLLAPYFRFLIRVLHADVRLSIAIGKDGWLFIERDISDLRHTTSLSIAEVAGIRDRVDLWCRYAETRGARLALMIAPNKSTIYSDKTPEHLTSFGQPSRIDQIMGADFTCPVIKVDPRAALQAARDQHVYYKWGTHWNNRGALLVWNLLRDKTREIEPRLIWLDAPVNIITTLPNGMQDSLWHWYGPGDPEVEMMARIETPASPLPQTSANAIRLLAVGDSFMDYTADPAPAFVGPFTVSGPTATTPPDNLQDANAWFIAGNYTIPIEAAMEAFKPNLVVLEIVERNAISLMELPAPPGYLQINAASNAYWNRGIGTDPTKPGVLIYAYPTQERAKIGDQVTFAGSGTRRIVDIRDVDPRRYIILVDAPLDPVTDGFPHAIKRH